MATRHHYEPLDPEHLTLQLTRMAAELLLFPFRAARATRMPWRPNETLPMQGQFIVSPLSYGALVYYDIVAEGGHGTRGEMRRVLDRLIEGTEVPVLDRPTMRAATTVALLRVRAPSAVSAPLLPNLDHYSYTVEPVDDAGVAHMARTAARVGRTVVREITAHVTGTRPRTKRGITNLAAMAAEAWTAALAADVSDEDWQRHLDEVEAMAQLSTALRMVGEVKPRRIAPKPTRLITLDES